jgi:cyclopropane-fatty-acyl-phospholipid synthase
VIEKVQNYVLSVLKRGVEQGALEVRCSAGCFSFGNPVEGTPTAIITVINDTSWLRIFMTGDLGFAEAYMLGELEVDELKAVSEIWLKNMAQLQGLFTVAHLVFTSFFKVASGIQGQSISRSLLNAIAGYSGSNPLYQAFLSKEMMYSCALWGPDEGGTTGDLYGISKPNDLEAAQRRKLFYVLEKARVKPGDRILEFGSGWCALAIEAARSFSCSVDTLTLSLDQKMLGEERIRAAGLENLIRVHLMDYRQLPPSFEKAFDAFISIEMIEHVGPRHYRKYFELVDWALKPKSATAIISSSTSSESRYSEYQTPDFSRYYMWPNGTLPCATALIKAASAASSGRLTLDTLENHGQHYPRTLREWARRFKKNVTPGVDQEMAHEQPAFANPESLEAFKRKWQYLFPTAEAGFSNGYLSCHMLTFVRDKI